MKLYTKLDADGRELPADATTHVVLIDHARNLMIDVRDTLVVNHYDAPAAVAELDLLGYTDWRMPTPMEAFGGLRHSTYPAYDADLYPNTRPNRYWTDQVAPEDSVCAFAVGCNHGSAGWSYRSSDGVVRAVRSLAPAAPSPGQ